MITPNDITVQDFKDQFYRDFDYLPVWSALTTYNVGDLVFYDVNQKFYTCKVDNTLGVIPTNTTNWTLTVANKKDYIWDEDISKAYEEAKITYNQASNSSDNSVMQSFLYLAAHYMVSDLRAGGLQSQSSGLVGSRSVGSVSESYVVPDWAKKETYSFYTTTYYGMKYLTLTRAYRIANVIVVPTPRHALSPYNYNSYGYLGNV